MKFKIFGTKIYVSFFFTALITVMLATDRTGIILPVLFATTMHELGHLFAMWLIDCTPKQIRLLPATIQITSEFSKRYRNDLIIAIMGPLTNIVLFLTLYLNYIFYKNNFILYNALINLLISIFNLLPINGLDGGTILLSILAKRTEYTRAKLIIRIITILSAAILLILAISFTIRGKFNISLYIIAIYILILTLIKN